MYGEPQFLPLTESHPTGNCTNPYGKTKYFTEEILKDLCTADDVSRDLEVPFDLTPLTPSFLKL